MLSSVFEHPLGFIKLMSEVLFDPALNAAG